MTDDTTAARASILEVQVEAALAGHDLGQFDEMNTVTRGWQAVCRRCARTGHQGLIYSQLGEQCPGCSEN